MTEGFIDPEILLTEVEAEKAKIPSERLFNDSQHQKLTEKWCAAKLGIGYSKFCRPCKVAVNESNERLDADIFLQDSNNTWPFQLAEVQRPGRKRGLMYKELAKGNLVLQPYEPEKGHNEGPHWIADAVRKKKLKNYSNADELNLLIYMNFDARELEYAEVQSACDPFRSDFQSIWVISFNLICSVYSNPEIGEIPGWGVTCSH